MKVAGIDFSTRAVDLVLLDEETTVASWHRIPLIEGRGTLAAARSLRGRFPGRSWFESEGVYLVALEETFSGHHAGTAKKLGMIAGAIAVLLPPDLTLLEIPAHEWKRETVGKAGSTKAAVQMWFTEVGFQANPGSGKWTQDAFDAYAIAWAARALNQRAIERGAA